MRNLGYTAFPIPLDCFLEVFQSIFFLFNYNNGFPKEGFSWRSLDFFQGYFFSFTHWPFLEISINPSTKILLSELQLYDIIHTVPFVALTIYHKKYKVGKHCVKNLELLILFLQAFATKFFQAQFSPDDLNNIHHNFLYPLFSALDDSLENFLTVLSSLCLVPLESNEITKTTEYLKKIKFDNKIQDLFKYILCTRFMTHKYYNSDTSQWEGNIFYKLSCKKSFLVINRTKNIF